MPRRGRSVYQVVNGELAYNKPDNGNALISADEETDGMG